MASVSNDLGCLTKMASGAVAACAGRSESEADLPPARCRQLRLRGASLLLGLVGGLGQLAIALLGDAIGGMSVTVILLGVAACVAVAGAVVILRWRRPGLVLMSVAALAAVVALFWTTWLEVAVATLLLAAVAATFISMRQEAAQR